MQYQFKIEYEDPKNVIKGKERRSKLLKVNSPLYNFCENLRNKCLTTYKGIKEKRMDFHTELVDQKVENEELIEKYLLERTALLEGKEHLFSLTTIGNALCLSGPFVAGYGDTHITIAYFSNGLPSKEDYNKLSFI